MDNNFNNMVTLSAVGPDRPGFVAEVAGFIADRGGNHVTMYGAELGGGMYGVYHSFTVPSEKVFERIVQDMRKLRQYGPTLYMNDGLKRRLHPATHLMTTYAFDSVGIVSKATGRLAESNVNILNVSGRQTSAPESGTPMFIMKMGLQIPPHVSVESVTKAMNELADQYGWDVEIVPYAEGDSFPMIPVTGLA